MFCSQCGAPMGDTDRFCANCGAPNAAAADAAPAGVAPVAPRQPQQEQPKGCLAQAFSDMTKGRGVFKRVCQIGFLPALIGIVSVVVLFIPVVGGIAGAIGLLLAFIASVCGSGYGIEWARDLVNDEQGGMERPLLRSTSFGLGLFSSVISGVLGFVALIPVIGVVISAFETTLVGAVGSYYYYDDGGLAASLIGSFGLLVLGLIASIVLSVFFKMFAEIAIMHFAVKKSVDSAFALDKVWAAFKHNKTKLFCAAILPELLVGIVVNLILWVLAAIFGAAAAASLVRSYGYGAPSGLSAIFSVGGFTLVLFLALGVFVCVFGDVFGKMLKYRAVGYWVKCYAPEWTAEDGDEVLTFMLPGEKAPAAEETSAVSETTTADAAVANTSVSGADETDAVDAAAESTPAPEPNADEAADDPELHGDVSAFDAADDDDDSSDNEGLAADGGAAEGAGRDDSPDTDPTTLL